MLFLVFKVTRNKQEWEAIVAQLREMYKEALDDEDLEFFRRWVHFQKQTKLNLDSSFYRSGH